MVTELTNFQLFSMKCAQHCSSFVSGSNLCFLVLGPSDADSFEGRVTLGGETSRVIGCWKSCGEDVLSISKKFTTSQKSEPLKSTSVKKIATSQTEFLSRFVCSLPPLFQSFSWGKLVVDYRHFLMKVCIFCPWNFKWLEQFLSSLKKEMCF
jgi:hypothetical protein